MSEETASALPYIQNLNGRDPLAVLAGTGTRLNALLDKLTPEQIERKPAPNKWNIREILAHLADCEIAWSWRFRQVYAEEKPTLQTFEQDDWGRAYASYSLEQARATWNALRAWNLALLGGLSPEERQRAAVHPKLGGVTLWTLAQIAAGHDLHHLQSLEHVADGLTKS